MIVLFWLSPSIALVMCCDLQAEDAERRLLTCMRLSAPVVASAPRRAFARVSALMATLNKLIVPSVPNDGVKLMPDEFLPPHL